MVGSCGQTGVSPVAVHALPRMLRAPDQLPLHRFCPQPCGEPAFAQVRLWRSLWIGAARKLVQPFPGESLRVLVWQFSPLGTGAKDTRVTFLRAFQPKLSTGVPRPCGYCEATGLAQASMPSAAIQGPQVRARDPRLHGPGELGCDAGRPRVRPGVAVDPQRCLVIVRARDHEPFHT